MGFEKKNANRGPMCAMKSFQWCGEACFAGAALLIDGFLLQISRRDRHKSIQT
jgi:hypothetical protein